jgi:hypothetical protein
MGGDVNARIALAIALAALVAGCSQPAPYATTVGVLKPGATMTVDVASGNVYVYRPLGSDPHDRFTVAATAKSGQEGAAPFVRPVRDGIVVTATSPLASLLVRVPDGVHFVVHDDDGSVRVTDITGSVDATVGRGDVTIMVPGYAQASTGAGRVSATFGATKWPGTLNFSSGRGDVDVYIRADVAFHAYLHTADGTLFSDFGLRGTSTGRSETISAAIDGGDDQGVRITTKRGVARLLRLVPQP